jgi:hypothetical protein
MDEFAEVMFQEGEWHWELMNYLLDFLKCDFGEVDEVIFQGVERPCEQIYCILDI